MFDVTGCNYCGLLLDISWCSGIDLLSANVTLFCRLVFSLQHIGKLEMFHATALPLFLCILQTFPHRPYPDTSLKVQRHLHRQRCCAHTILIVHVCLYVCVFSVYDALPFVSVFIVFILSLYGSLTGFKILSKSAYIINGTLN